MSYLSSRRSLRVFVAFFLLFGAVITSWTVATRSALAQAEYLLGIPDVFGMNVYDRQAVQTTFTNATGTSFRAPTTKTYSVKFKNGPAVDVTESSVYSHEGLPFVQLSQGNNLNLGVWTATSSEYTGFMGWVVNLKEEWDDYRALMQDAGYDMVALDQDKNFIYYQVPDGSEFQGANNILLKLIDESDAPAAIQVNQTPSGLTYMDNVNNIAWSAVDPRAVADQFQAVHGLPYNNDYRLDDSGIKCYNDDGTPNMTHVLPPNDPNHPTDHANGVTRFDLYYVLTDTPGLDTQVQIEKNILHGTASNPVYPCDAVNTPTKSFHKLEWYTPIINGSSTIPPSYFAQQLTDAGMHRIFDVYAPGVPDQFFVTRWKGPGGLYFEVTNRLFKR